MQITAVDQYQDLYQITDFCPADFVEQIVKTDWLALSWRPQDGQESWPRRRINDHELPWLDQWDQHCHAVWPQIANALGRKLKVYHSTAWWVDEPGFICKMHTDGEMPGAMQLCWIGAQNLGTSFYHYRNPASLRYQFAMNANTGYVMINSPDSVGARHLQWHAMLNPVPKNTFRVTSYSWLAEETYD